MSKIVYTRTKKALNEIGRMAVSRIRRFLTTEKHPPHGQPSQATGKTGRSTNYSVDQKGDVYTMGISSRRSGNYQILYIIDKGRRKGGPSNAPPYGDILEWMQAKGITGTRRNPKANAIGIAQAIARNGVRPRNVFDRALTPERSKGEAKITTALGQDIDKYVDENMPKQNRKK